MAAKVIDLAKYTDLLTQAHPVVIETEEENERVLALVQRLSRKRHRSFEEQELLKLLVRLVEDFEEICGACLDRKESPPRYSAVSVESARRRPRFFLRCSTFRLNC